MIAFSISSTLVACPSATLGNPWIQAMEDAECGARVNEYERGTGVAEGLNVIIQQKVKQYC